MTNDLIYAFDKITFQSSVLGEIQSGFNMSFVIDGTKDSAKIIVWSWSSVEIEPYTILWHKNTDSWWIVSSDKVERYQSEEGMLYIHSLDLVGAIELLNARDLTDCGFNDNTYNVFQFISRLFALSNFEYTVDYSNIDSNFKNKKVDFIKTFENYTLLSALREFLDAYNMCPKLSFGYTEYQGYRIIDAILKITPKTGDYSLTSHINSDFYDVKQIKTMNKESFGTCVISNAENVISNKPKTYPSTGSVRLSGTQDNITASNAVIRLPSKVFKGNWIKIIYPYYIGVSLSFGDTLIQSEDNAIPYYPNSVNSSDKIITLLRNVINGANATQEFKNAALASVNNNLDYIKDRLKKAGTITLYEGNKLVPDFGQNNDQIGKIKIEKGTNVPYLATITENDSGLLNVDRAMIFCDKDTRKTLPLEYQGIAWERGSNLISGFDFLSHKNKSKILYTDLQENTSIIFEYKENNSAYVRLEFPFTPIISQSSSDLSNLSTISFIVDYIPMNDIKIKVDNQRDKKDIKLYNQNGRLTDNVALSKLINSYSKEISSDTITLYRQDYLYSNCPKVGSIVYIGNDPYVVNNVSLDFSLNEELGEMGYFVNGEYTMCKYISTKSLMVNPNTNIRDYGIPQNYNVKRKQLYRDYYEFTYQAYDDANVDTPYWQFANAFDFTNKTQEISNFIAIMKIEYDNEIGDPSSSNWYYQLETTNYYLDKMLYVVLDFNDNNIIGYSSQNVFSGFIISRIFDGLTDTLNTPISYVDNDGKLKGLDILLSTNNQVTNIYNEYQNNNGGSNWKGSLYNYSVFIPHEIYDAAVQSLGHDIRITEEYYMKDALEVPVFEYVLQIGDSEQVLIGDNILCQYSNCLYFYSYVLGNEGQMFNQNNVLNTNELQDVTSPIGWRIFNGCTIGTVSGGKLRITLKNYARYDVETGLWSYGGNVNATPNRDIAIFRTSLDLTTGQVVADDLILIARNVPSSAIDGAKIDLIGNYYKLK